MQKFLSVFFKIILFLGIWMVAVAFIPVGPYRNEAELRLWNEFIPFAAVIILTFMFIVIDGNRLRLQVGYHFSKSIVIGLILGIAWFGLAIGIIYGSGSLTINGKNSVPLLYIWIFAAFLNVIMQEVLVRGFIYQLVKREYGLFWAFVITTGMFTVMHAGSIELGVIPILNVITMSLFMTMVMEYMNSLTVPIIIHSVWNIIGCIIFGNGGLAEDYPVLYNLAFSGNELISGGASQIEGSVVVLILNTVLFFMFFMMYGIRKHG